MADEGGEGVGDAAVLERHQRERRVLEPLEPAAAAVAGAPERAVPLHAAQPRVQRHRHTGLVEQAPHRVEAGMPRRHVAVPVHIGHRSRDHDQDAGAGVEHPGDLGLGQRGIGERDHGRRVQPAVPAVETPVVVQPAVERRERRVEGGNVTPERLLHPDTERGEQQRPLEALLVEETDPGGAVLVPGMVGERVELAEHRLQVEALGVAATEVVLEAAGAGDRVERRVGDELVDPAAHQQPPLAVDLGPLHAPLAHAGLDVAGEGVGGLVVVVVGVERPEVQRSHAAMVGADMTRLSDTVGIEPRTRRMARSFTVARQLVPESGGRGNEFRIRNPCLNLVRTEPIASGSSRGAPAGPGVTAGGRRRRR